MTRILLLPVVLAAVLSCGEFALTIEDTESEAIASPVFSIAGGLIKSGTVVALGCATDGAEIQYSIDGSTYLGGSSFTVESDGTVYAKAVKEGYGDSPIVSASYTLSELKLQIAYEMGTVSSYSNAYVAWVQNNDDGFIQNLGVCARVAAQNLTGTAMPYWETNVRPDSDSAEIDAVTAATDKNQDFALTARPISDEQERRFTVYFETDRSFDGNDWFGDQPAVLYAAEVDFDSGATEYTLSPCGWTRNEHNTNVSGDDPETLPVGTIRTEMRYITDKKPFGTADTDNSSLNMVKSVKLIIQ